MPRPGMTTSLYSAVLVGLQRRADADRAVGGVILEVGVVLRDEVVHPRRDGQAGGLIDHPPPGPDAPLEREIPRDGPSTLAYGLDSGQIGRPILRRGEYALPLAIFVFRGDSREPVATFGVGGRLETAERVAERRRGPHVDAGDRPAGVLVAERPDDFQAGAGNEVEPGAVIRDVGSAGPGLPVANGGIFSASGMSRVATYSNRVSIPGPEITSIATRSRPTPWSVNRPFASDATAG